MLTLLTKLETDAEKKKTEQDFDCPLFRLQRIALLTNLAEYQPFDSQLLLSGDLNLSLEINMKIALEVQTFLKSTKRFD